MAEPLIVGSITILDVINDKDTPRLSISPSPDVATSTGLVDQALTHFPPLSIADEKTEKQDKLIIMISSTDTMRI